MPQGRNYGMFAKPDPRPKFAPGWSLPPAQQIAFEEPAALRSGLIKYGVVEHVDLIQRRPTTQALVDLYLLVQQVHRSLIISLVGLSTIFTEMYGLYCHEDQSCQYLVQVIDNFIYVSREFIGILEDVAGPEGLASKSKKLADELRLALKEGGASKEVKEQMKRDGIREVIKERVSHGDRMTVCRNSATEFLMMFEDVVMPVLNYTLSESDELDPRLSQLADHIHSYSHCLHAISLQLLRERPEAWEAASTDFVTLHRLSMNWGEIIAKGNKVAGAIRLDTETFLGQKGQVSLMSRAQLIAMMDVLHGRWEWTTDGGNRGSEASLR